MASLRKRPTSRYWVACYVDGDGVQRQRSTRLLDRSKAQRVADAFEAVYQRQQTEAQIRRSLAAIFEDVSGRPLCSTTLADWFATWLERVRPEVSPKTYLQYGDMTRLVLKASPDLGARIIDRIEPKELLELRGRLAAMRSATTTNQTLKILRQCLKAAWMEGLIPENPAARVPRVRVDHSEESVKRPFTVEEIRAILRAADDEWKGMVLAGLYTAGQRLRDIATLTAGQVDLAAGAVRFTTDKTGRVVIVPIAAPWLPDLRRRVKGLAPTARVFPKAYARFVAAGNDVGRVSNSFRRLLAKVGLAPRGNRKREGAVEGRRQANPLSFHSFRHTATSMLKNAGVGDSVARDIVGHESEAVSKAYTHIDEATKRAAMAKLPDVTG